jgi:SAM-dependent methyltransferase
VGSNKRVIDQHRAGWAAKPSLRAVYEDLHRRSLALCKEGGLLEIGGGSGHIKTYAPHAICLDIQHAPWLDVIADAHQLPFPDSSFENIVMLDVLHHLAYPRTFLAEALRVLKPGGRLVITEPGVSPVSWLIYNLLHDEPATLGADLWNDAPQTGARPEEANQAIPHLMFYAHAKKLAAEFPDMKIIERRRLSLWAYPLSGGFNSWSLIPPSWVRPVLKIEEAVMPILGPLAAFRMMVVVEKAKGSR